MAGFGSIAPDMKEPGADLASTDDLVGATASAGRRPPSPLRVALGAIMPPLGVSDALGTTPSKIDRIGDAVYGGMQNWIETPGRAMDEGITTDRAVGWAAPTALGMIGMGRFPGAAPEVMTTPRSQPKPPFSWDAARTAESSLGPEASRALDAWVGGPLDAAKNPDFVGGIWNRDRLTNALSDPVIGQQIRAAFDPVRQGLQATHGDKITLYRAAGDLPAGSAPHDYLSYTGDRAFAEAHAGVQKPRRIYGEDEIAAIEKQITQKGEADLNGRLKLKKGEYGGVDLYNRNEHITGYSDAKDFLTQHNEMAAEHNAERAARLARVSERSIPIDDIVAATDRFNQKEFIIRNRGKFGSGANDARSSAANIGIVAGSPQQPRVLTGEELWNGIVAPAARE